MVIEPNFLLQFVSITLYGFTFMVLYMFIQKQNKEIKMTFNIESKY